MSKTQEAIRLHREGGLTVAQAARQMEISETAVYAALKRLEKKEAKLAGLEPCPCCQTQVPKEKIDWNVIK